MRILLDLSDPPTCDMVRTRLHLLGHETVGAQEWERGGTEPASSFDLLITDTGLGEAHDAGPTTLDRLLAHPELRDIPTIIHSPYFDGRQPLPPWLAFARGVLPMPFHGRQLASLLETMGMGAES